jgi:Protein of unknown function (DUF4240)
MTDEEFWALIDLIGGPGDTQESETGDDDETVAPLVRALSRLEPEQITGFDDQLAAKVYALDGREFARAAGVAGEYEDLFLDARLCVVANGRAIYEAVLASPEAMPNMKFGALLFCAERAWEIRTGEEYDYEPSPSVEMGANQANW